MRLDLDALPQIGQPTSTDGVPLQLPVADIDEDPVQPRREFDAQALRELADSITARGLLQAISVRHHPEQAQRWMVNFGARRLRACRLAGLMSIAATVNETAGSYDQVIENEQREGLKPLELALFVQSRLALGESQAEIARQLGKSGPYVTYATALIDAPDWLMSLYRDGRCRGLRELHELRQLARQHPDCVSELETHVGPITREVVASIKSKSSQAARPTEAVPESIARAAALIGSARPGTDSGSSERQATRRVVTDAVPNTEPVGRTLVLLADLHGSTVEVVVDAAPQADGKIFVRAGRGDPHDAVDAGSLKLLRIVRRHLDP
jgi:ParB family chromosome partitioning protein